MTAGTSGFILPAMVANCDVRPCERPDCVDGTFRDGASFFIEPLVFLSNAAVKSHLSGNAAFGVCFKDSEKQTADDTRPGIMGAIRRRDCPGLRQFESSPVNRPLIKAITQAMEQAKRRAADNEE